MDIFIQITVVGPLDFLKVVRLVFWSGVVGPGFRSLALRAHSRATRSKARLVSKSIGPPEHRVGAFVYRNAGKVYCVGHVDTSVVRCI